jgi:F0F1-type ATP synthase delta subunit
MKIPAKLYAKVFSEITKGKNSAEIERLAKKLAAVIVKNGDSNRAREILKFAERYAREAAGKHLVNVETARELPENLYAEIVRKLGEDKYDFAKNINEDLVAGAKLTIDDERQFDLSLRAILNNLFNIKEK